MLSFVRPAPRPDFAAASAKMLGELRAEVACRGRPHTDDFKARAIWSGSFKGGVHKRQLCDHRFLVKCAWCERLYEPGRELDIEHYRPKTEATVWKGTPGLVGDTPPEEDKAAAQAGYWWLAFHWDNYSLSCKPCNQGWKRNLFPVVGSRCTEGNEHLERPLLLDPGAPFRTSEHFRWDREGYLWPVSDVGRATIITCGLNRSPLVSLRLKAQREIDRELRDIIDGLRGGRRSERSLRALAARGERHAEFAGMVRWQTEEALGILWEEIDGMPA